MLSALQIRRILPHPAVLIGFILTVVTGCLSSLDDRDQAIDAPSGTRSAVIQALLDPRATVQSVWVEWSIPADSSWGGQPRPLDPGLVHLSLVGPDGIPVQLTPGAPGQFAAQLPPGAPGQFAAQLQVMPDSTYALEGTIESSLVSATVTIPDSIKLVSPGTDTVRITRESLFRVSFPYEFTAPGASVFFLVDQNGPFYHLRSPRGVQSLFAYEDTLRLTLDAYERYGGEWLNERPTASNISGAYGFLGAFVRSQTIVVIVQ